MLRSTIALLLVTLSILSHVDARKHSVSHPKASRNPLPLPVSSNILPLTRQKKSGKGRGAAALLGLEKIPTSRHVTQLTSLAIGEEFATEITFGKQKFLTIVDTGSSDTWIVEKGFQCIDFTGAPLPEAICNFGPTCTPSETFFQTPNENFAITYADGEFVTGIIGTEDVKLAGLKVKQTVGIVNNAAWLGDGATSGILGLAYPDLTSAYAGTDPSQDNGPGGQWIPYSPIFDTMVSDGLIPDLFSLAILRDVSGPSGYLAFGGLPPVSFKGNFTSTPILLTTFDVSGQSLALPLFYTINIDSVLLHGKPLPGSGGPGVQYILDSGTTLNYFPTSVANAFNAAFKPPAVYSATDGVYYVDCKAKKPALDIVIGGTKFDTNPLDVILFWGTDANGSDICITGVTDGGGLPTEDLYILGDTFQKNVISVFDVGAAQMRFVAREHYPSNDLY